MLQNNLANHDIWKIWASSLKRWRLENLVAHLLELAGPVNIFCAQLIYLSQPFITGVVSDKHLRGMANVLEDSNQAKEFARYLRGGE